MHGLRCSPEIPGFTRLLDEWVVGLTRYAGQPEGVFASQEAFERSFTEACTRVRAFAWGAGQVEPTQVVQGVASVELQGYDYHVAVRSLSVRTPEALAEHAELAMVRAVEAALASAPEGGECVPVGVVLVSVEKPEVTAAQAPLSGDPAAELARSYRDVTRGLASTGAAWSFPSDEEGPDYAYAGEGHLGGILLARR